MKPLHVYSGKRIKKIILNVIIITSFGYLRIDYSYNFYAYSLMPEFKKFLSQLTHSGIGYNFFDILLE